MKSKALRRLAITNTPEISGVAAHVTSALNLPANVRRSPLKQVTITTDGSCEPNPGAGGWAAILRYGSSTKEISGRIAVTTNNGAEFAAIVHALAALKESCAVLIRADSKCAIAWCRLSNKPRMMTNPKYAHIRDLIIQYRRHIGRHRISFEWLKGHFGDPDNERCDRLANDARNRPF